MLEVACNLCGGTDTRLLYPSTIDKAALSEDPGEYSCTNPGYGRHHAIVKCVTCDLVYASPRPEDGSVLGSYEAVEDPTYQEERDGRVLTFERHLRRLEKFKAPPGRLLDVGSYTGVFLEVAERHGWDAVGLEPSKWAVEQARSKGLQVVEGTLADADLENGSYDVVTMWDVIEHLTDPASAIERSYELLKPGGMLVLHTMDIDSVFARVMGSRWPWFMQMHLYYFSRRTLTAMAERTGLEVVDAAPQGRYLRLGYLATRVGALAGERLGRLVGALVRGLRLHRLPVPINARDLFTLHAIK